MRLEKIKLFLGLVSKSMRRLRKMYKVVCLPCAISEMYTLLMMMPNSEWHMHGIDSRMITQKDDSSPHSKTY